LNKTEAHHPLARACLKKLTPPDFLNQREKRNLRAIDFASTTGGRGAIGKYPPDVLSDLAKKYLRVMKAPVSLLSSQILFTRGASEGIDLVLRTFCEPGVDKVVTTAPSFPMVAHWAQALGARISFCPLGGENFNVINEKAIAREAAKVVFFINPNNPVGSLLDSRMLTRVAARNRELVVIDEAYIDFCSEASSVSLLRFPNVLILRSFSKAWGLAGARLGVILGHPRAIFSLRTLQGPYAVPLPVQKIFGQKLKRPGDVSAYADRVKNERRRMYKFLASLSFVEHVYPSQSGFVCFRCRPATFTKVKLALAKSGAIIHDASAQVKFALRVSICSRPRNQWLMNRLKKIEEKLC
jgi:histidinol-phosphate aminotransferase